MRIEEITKARLKKARDEELNGLKVRFTGLWDKEMKKSLWSDSVRNGFLKKYLLLLDEMKSRKLENSTCAIDKAAFRKTMILRKFGIDVADLDDMVIVPNCIVADAASVDFKKIEALANEQYEEFSKMFEQQDEPETSYIPLYDLVLRAKQETVKVEIQKPYPNEHSARLQSPTMTHIRVRRTSGGKVQGVTVPSSVGVIWFVAIKNGKEVPIPQALRFPTKTWTAAKARKWLSDNDITSIKFEPATKVAKAIWSGKFINKLPDSAFLYIESGGEKDDEGKTKPRSLRHFPYKDSSGKVDLPHLRNAIARIPQSKLPKDVRDRVQAKARKLLEDVKEGKRFEKLVSVYPIDKADKEEHIVCGVVYEPDVVDAQGDKANEVEIRKAAYQFMEEVQTFKVNHEGKKVKVKVLESYVAPVDFTVAKKPIKKGSWVLTVRVLDKKIWDAVKSGELTGFSMAGYAKAS